ncbi:hypothetical protein PMPD1_1165 [Paramixta manurensis]|uniref:Uncharacterized protein n=1 Tax=Paramixta manurensis TaxID=2740817 RepID=A0A6M8UEK4_9GAMM|nr:hypothetical protein PMPD1_1165 [Erwiniaceae bacterium PD-1]
MTSGKKRSTHQTGIIGGLALLLTGCQAQHPHTPTAAELAKMAEESCTAAPTSQRERCVYVHQMQYGIERNFYDAGQYKGRRCTLQVQYNANHRYSVLRTMGDEALCLKAWGAVSSAKNLPPPPKGIPGLTLDIKPR